MLKLATVGLIGPAESGKTALAKSIARRDFVESYNPTVGVYFFDFQTLQIWDNKAGPPLLGIGSLSDADIIIYTVDLSKDLADQQAYLQEIHQSVKSELLIYLVGMKVDKKRSISSKDLQGLGAKLGATLTFECSAKTGRGIDQLRDTLIKAAKAKLGIAQDQSETKQDSAQNTEKDALLKKQNKPCWACFCCGWGSGSTKKIWISNRLGIKFRLAIQGLNLTNFYAHSQKFTSPPKLLLTNAPLYSSPGLKLTTRHAFAAS